MNTALTEPLRWFPQYLQENYGVGVVAPEECWMA
jgi:hypothetical protein